MAKITDEIRASQWTVATEEAVKTMTLAELRTFILNNSEVEEDEYEESHIHVGRSNLWGKTYMLTGKEYGRDEFFITRDCRVFYLISLNHRVEIVDDTEPDRENTRKIAKEIDRRLVDNHMEITITMKRSGEEYSIVQLLSHELMVHTGRGTNELGETIWNTKVGVFKDSYKLARYIMQIQ